MFARWIKSAAFDAGVEPGDWQCKAGRHSFNFDSLSPEQSGVTNQRFQPERVLCFLSAAKRKRSKRPTVANVGVESKTRPCSPQGQIHHAANKRGHSDRDAVEISGSRTVWNRRDNSGQHSGNKERVLCSLSGGATGTSVEGDGQRPLSAAHQASAGVATGPSSQQWSLHHHSENKETVEHRAYPRLILPARAKARPSLKCPAWVLRRSERSLHAFDRQCGLRVLEGPGAPEECVKTCHAHPILDWMNLCLEATTLCGCFMLATVKLIG